VISKEGKWKGDREKGKAPEVEDELLYRAFSFFCRVLCEKHGICFQNSTGMTWNDTPLQCHSSAYLASALCLLTGRDQKEVLVSLHAEGNGRLGRRCTATLLLFGRLKGPGVTRVQPLRRFDISPQSEETLSG
jgi:hypothetical protein